MADVGADGGGAVGAAHFEMAADAGHAVETERGVHGARVGVAKERKFLVAAL